MFCNCNTAPRLCVVALIASLVLCAIPGFADWDLASAYLQDQQNPNGDWTLGYVDSTGAFTAYTGTNTATIGNATSYGWMSAAGWDPHGNISYNIGPDVITNWDSYREAGLPLALAATTPGDKVTARWTCPTDGTYAVVAHFTGQSTISQGTVANIFVNLNGNALLGSNLSGFVGRSSSNYSDGYGTSKEVTFCDTLAMKSGDTLDFMAEDTIVTNATGFNIQIGDPSTVAQLSGTVTNASDSSSISDARVTAYASNGMSYTAMTDSNGAYNLLLSPGTYQVLAYKRGFLPQSTTDINVTLGSPAAQNFVLSARTSAAATFYVSDSGNDFNDGTSTEKAWKSIDNGEKLGILVPGDTVVASGTFNTSVALGSTSGTASAPITYRGNNASIIAPSGAAGITISGASAKYIVVDGFDISGGQFGVRCNSSASNITVKSCFIHDINPQSTGEGGGIRDENTTDSLYANNVVFNVGYPYRTDTIPQGCIAVGGSINAQIYNNTFDTASDALRLWNNSKNIKFKNNICINMRWHGVHSDDASSIDNSNNLFFANAADYDNIAVGANEFSADPSFAGGSGSSYYMLNDGSPAINTGVNVNLPYNGPAPDLGAYETESTAVYGVLTGKASLATNNYRPAGGLMGATITTADGTISAKTDANGSYTIPLPSGSYDVTAEYTGLQSTPNPASVTITDGGTTVQDFSFVGSGNTYYVKPDGDDSKSGTSLDEAWKTINNGDIRNALQPGDTVEVEAGTYPQADGFGIKLMNCNGTEQAPIVYKANGKVIIDQTGVTPIWGGADLMCVYAWVNGIVLDGFEFRNAQWGVFFENGKNNNVVANCIIHDMKPVNASSGFATDMCGGVVCAFANNDLVINNVIYNIGKSTGASGCVAITGASNTKLYNNTLDNADTCLFDWYTPGPVEFKNNIVTNITGIALKHPVSNSVTNTNNLFFNNAVDYGANVTRGLNEFNSDPQFDTDYTLKSTSPAIDSGTDIGMPFKGTAPDLGACESTYSVNRAYVTGKVTIDNTTPLSATVKASDVSVSTYADGTYVIPVAAGSVTLVATAAGFDPMTVMVTATAGQTTTKDITFSFANAEAKSPAELKDLPEGAIVKLGSCIATAGSNTFDDGSFYIEDTSRACGVKAVLSAEVAAVYQNDKADFIGKVAKDSTTGETYLAVNFVLNKESGKILRPLGMTNKAICGAGISTKGLLVTTWGKVTHKDAANAFMYVDDGSNINDGSGYTGIKVMLTGTKDSNLPKAVEEGDNVTVTGIVEAVNGFNVLLPRSSMDVSNLKDQHVVAYSSEVGIAWDPTINTWETDVNDSSEVYPTVAADGLKFTESASQGWNQVHFRAYDGTPLSSLNKLQYGEFINTMSSVQSNLTMSIKLFIDTNGDGDDDIFLISEPWKQGFNGVPGTWQAWDVLNDCSWWCIKADWTAVLVDRDHAKPLSAYATDYPGATLCTQYDGSIVLFASDLGAPSANFVVTLGSLAVGTTNGGTTVYSFAP